MRRTTRRIPGTRWVTVFASRAAEPGHGWMYGGLVRRDCWRLPARLPGMLGGLNVGVMVMDRAHRSRYTGTRLAVYEKSYGPLNT